MHPPPSPGGLRRSARHAAKMQLVLDRLQGTGIIMGGTSIGSHWDEARMPSSSLHRWFAERAATLADIENAHRSVRGSGPGARAPAQQINQAYAVLLSAQFQGFCRHLHSERADY